MKRNFHDVCVEPECGKETINCKMRCEPHRMARLKQYNHDWQAKYRDIRSTTKRTVKVQRNEESLIAAHAMLREPQNTFTCSQLQHARVGGKFEAMVNKMLRIT